MSRGPEGGPRSADWWRVAACGAVLVLGGPLGVAAEDGSHESVESEAVDHRLGPRASREDCFDAEGGARVAYSLAFTGEVRFDLHHHVGDETFYDVEPSQLREAAQVVDLPEAGRYCLMYTNLEAGYAYVRGHYRLLPP